MKNRVVVTGGNGRIGKAILKTLKERGYYTIDLARGKRRENVSDLYLRTNLLNPGQVYGSLAKSNTEAIIHMGTIPGPRNNPGYITYRSNVMSSYYILEASMELEVSSVCIASSINAIGYAYQDEPIEIQYLPVDEDHPTSPRDPYGLGKKALEVTANGFGRLNRPPYTISTLRYPWVAQEEELRSTYTEANRSLKTLKETSDYSGPLFSYIHVQDAAQAALQAIEARFNGHEVFWAVADDTTADVPTSKLVAEFFPDVEMKERISGHEGLINIEKAKRFLDWEPQYSWRDL